MSEIELQSLIEEIVNSVLSSTGTETIRKEVNGEEKKESDIENDFIVEDISAIDLSKDLQVKNPHNKEAYLKMMSTTAARLGVGRAGSRYLTTSSLRFRADHAAAMDAVFSKVNQKDLDDLNQEILQVKTLCTNKDEYITRPDYGKKFDEETSKMIKDYAIANANVQIIIGDGLSSAAIGANIKDVLPSLEQGLKSFNLSLSKLIFVEYARVGAMDAISELTNADVTLILIGERPGLATAESMSAYIAYKATVCMPEARRTVISNIHKRGTPAIEAGAQIATIVKKMVDEKVSGLDLKL